MNRIFLILCLVMAPVVSSIAAPTQILLGHASKQAVFDDTTSVAADVFRQEVSRLSDQRLRVEIASDGMLGGNRDMAALVEKGVIQSAMVTLGGITPLYPPLNVFFLPYAFDHIQMARRVMDGPLRKAFAEGMESTQIKLLGFVDPPGFQIITNSSSEIRTPAQLKGLRIRAVPGAKPLEAMLDSVGAIPVKISSREEISALATGAIHGQMNTASSIISRGVDTVQQYATLTNHAYLPYVWIYNRAAFDALGEADQKVIELAVKKSISLAYQRAVELERSDQGTRGLQRRLQVRQLSANDRAAFKAAMRPAAEKAIVKQIGENGNEWVQLFNKVTGH